MNAIKNYILNLDFVQKHIADELRDISIAKGPQTLEISYSIKKEAGEQALKMVSELLGTVNESEILTVNEQKGFVFIGGERIIPEQALAMQQEAEMITNTYLWKVMCSTIEASAQKRIFEKSTTMDDVMAGKMALYNLSLFKKMINTFKTYVAK